MSMKPQMRGFQSLRPAMMQNMGSTRAGSKNMKDGGMTNDSGFDDDVKKAKSGLYMKKDDDKVYSQVRNMGPSMAARRLEDRGVDTKGMIGNRANAEDLGSYKKGGMVKTDMMQEAVNKHEGRLHKGEPMTKLAKGGSASSRADGCATKGKTKGTMIKMSMGGKAC